LSVKKPIKNLVWFIAGAVIVNVTLYFTAGWSPDSESFVVLSALIQTIIAAAAVTALVFPGYFDSLKQKQNLSATVDRELGSQRSRLISSLNEELKYFELAKLLLDKEAGDWLGFEKYFKLKLQEPSPLVPSPEDSTELLSEAEKFGLSYKEHHDTIYIFEMYDTEQYQIARSYLESDAGDIDSKNLNGLAGAAEIGLLEYELKTTANKKIKSLQRILNDLTGD
jgi:hypothetical protein